MIDNASSDGSLEFLSGQAGIRTIENRENLGFGRAANQGVQESKKPYILLLNADTEALPGSLETLEAFLNRNPAAGVVAPQLLFPEGKLQPSCRNFPTPLNNFLFLSYLDYLIPAGYRISKRKHKRLMKVDQPMGAALMIRRSALDTIGCFDPRFSLYMEEVDLCKRMKEGGFEIFYLPEAKFFHHAGGSTRQDWERSQMEYFRNVIRYFQKHFPEKRLSSVKFTLSTALILRSFVLFLAGRFRQSKFYLNQAFDFNHGATEHTEKHFL